MSKTKQKILDAALELFNRDGVVNVRLQHIADEAFVSVGNLAYHYPNKAAILEALYQDLAKRQQELLATYRVVPLFDNIDRLIHETFQLQQVFLFFYLDTLEITRAYPEIGQAHRQHIRSQIGQLKVILDFNVSRGALVEQLEGDTIDQLALQIWASLHFWLAQQVVRDGTPPDGQLYRLAIWHLLMPYFTPMGVLEYQQMLQMPYDFFF